jgi:hypothetical protein
MKLRELPSGFGVPGVAEGIAQRLSDLNATEDASLLTRDDQANARAFIATDVGLVDWRFTEPSTWAFEMPAYAWDAAPEARIVFAWVGSYSRSRSSAPTAHACPMAHARGSG